MGLINPKLLVTSDVHLGSLDCERDLFIQFLKNVINGGFGKDLQVLILLGDFIDLCTDIPKTLLKREKVQKILSLLIEIKNSINVIYVLGNHEIPVTRDYDEKFTRRRKKFLEKFSKSDFRELFDEKIFCQYLILKRWNDEAMLFMYNERDQIEENPIDKVPLEGFNLREDYKCLMTHGYQFDSEIYRFFVGQIWKSLISSNNFEIKETYDYFWNNIIKNSRKIKPVTFQNMKDELAVLKNKSKEVIDTQFLGLSSLEFNLIKSNMRVMKKWQKVSKPDYYFNEIKSFLEDGRYNFSEINHLIYGHSHHKEVFHGIVNGHSIEIVNDGAWQHIKPSYVEIHNEGNLILKSYP
ncbi:MAG: metallophosphoesterase [Candidatus Thorarchaeota archaeon]